MRLTYTIGLAITLLLAPVAASANCVPYAVAVTDIEAQFNERPTLEYDADAAPADRFVFFVSPDLSSVTVMVVRKTDEGEVACTVKGASGTALRPATLPGNPA